MARKGNGVEVRPNSIRLFFVWNGRDCRETLRINGAPAAPTVANIRYAERIGAEIRDRIKHGTFVYGDYFPASAGATTGRGQTLGEWLDTWLAAQRIEHSTKAGYSSAIKFWKAAEVDAVPMGQWPLRGIKHSDIKRALATRPTLSGKTVNNYVSVLREALALAVLDGKIPSSPAAGIARTPHQKDPPDPFERDEAEKIIAHLAKHHEGQVHNLVEFWMFTGLRTSEIAALQWPNVDEASGRILVKEALVRGKAKGNTKTNVARTVILNSRAIAALARQRQHTLLGGKHVFLDPRYGEPWTEERAFRRSYWTPTLKLLGIRYRRPYNMRHTFATMMLMAGRTPGWCAKQLGHSVEMFLRTYAKWIDGAQDDREMQGMEAWLAPPAGKEKAR